MIKPEYSECGIYEGETKLAALYANANSCDYRFGGETVETKAGAHAGAQVECEEESDAIELKATALKFDCIAIPEQEVAGVHYENAEAAGVKEITLEATITGIESQTLPSLACPTESQEVETHGNGTLIGQTTLKAQNAEEEPVGIWVAPPVEEEGLDFHSDSQSGATFLKAEADPSEPQQIFYDNEEENEEHVDCNEVNVRNATITANEGTTANEVTVEPIYNQEELTCKAGAPETEVNARITTNGCHYTFHGETTEDVTGRQSAPVNIVCPAGKEITVDLTVFNFQCIHIPPQELEGVVYKNEATEPETLTIEAKVHGIHSTTTENAACDEGTNTNGLYEGKITIKDYEDEAHENQVNITTTEP